MRDHHNIYACSQQYRGSGEREGGRERARERQTEREGEREGGERERDVVISIHLSMQEIRQLVKQFSLCNTFTSIY